MQITHTCTHLDQDGPDITMFIIHGIRMDLAIYHLYLGVIHMRQLRRGKRVNKESHILLLSPSPYRIQKYYSNIN